MPPAPASTPVRRLSRTVCPAPPSRFGDVLRDGARARLGASTLHTDPRPPLSAVGAADDKTRI
ncbi:hypothetical protein ABZ935_36180 [Streptomyces coeruleorubidus]|uniref:hypothetical protein n=1 Tax=Streptomyces coeruleorubidus TaxID=116188 RepID=UPI0033E8F62B